MEESQKEVRIEYIPPIAGAGYGLADQRFESENFTKLGDLGLFNG